jgi:hypothetical protein
MRNEVIKVTPSIAAEWLSKNINNRPLSKMRIELYSKDMESDKWHLTQQGISFDTDGNLIDGQHRLHAVIKSGKTVDFLVSFDLPPETKYYIDNGKARTLADNIHYIGKSDVTTIAALTIRILVYGAGRKAVFSSGKGGTSHAIKMKVTKADQIDFYYENQEMIDYCAHVGRDIYRTSSTKLISPTDLAFAFWLFGMTDESRLFIESVYAGVGLTRDTSAFLLRKILEENKLGKRRLLGYEITQYWVKAWEKRNEKITRLVIK